MSQIRIVSDIGKLLDLSPKQVKWLDVFVTIQREEGEIKTGGNFIDVIGYQFTMKTSDLKNTLTMFKKMGIIRHIDINTWLLNHEMFHAIISNPYNCFLLVKYDHEANCNQIVSRNFSSQLR